MSDHAIGNAKAWLESIVEMMARLAAASEEGDTEAEDTTREEIDHSPLSIRVRGGWFTPGAQAEAEPEEFEILLSTGGPALRIVGDLGSFCSPEEPRLQWQDWGTPWTDYPVDDSAARKALHAFCECFWFGE